MIASAPTRAVIFKSTDQLGGMEDEYQRRELTPENDYTWNEKARLIRRDPTVALGRAILASPLIKNEWQIEGRSKRAVKLLTDVLLPHRGELMMQAIFSGIDFGWQGWEVRPMKVRGQKSKHIKFKPLNHDFTTVTLDRNGFPNGMKNHSPYTTVPHTMEPQFIGSKYMAIAAASSEYGNPYGQALLRNVEGAFDSYNIVEQGAGRYVERTAGAHWVLWYPVGTSKLGEEELDNAIIADRVLNGLQASGQVALPVTSEEFSEYIKNISTTDARKSAWHLELITSDSGGDPFLDREKYLDALKMRGLFIPERVALEGQFGTKAESSEHADIALIVMEQWAQSIINWFNSPYGFVARVLEFNNIAWYPGVAQIVPLPLADSDKVFMREIFRTIVNTTGDNAVIVDIEKIGKKAGVPIEEGAKQILQEAIKKNIKVADPNKRTSGGNKKKAGTSKAGADRNA